jgi:hypothetical protein
MNALAVATGEQALEFFAFEGSYVEKLRAGDAHIEGHFVNYFSELIRLKLRSCLNSKEARVLLHRTKQSFKSCYTSRLDVRVKVHRQRAGVSAYVCSGRLCDS